ncbi:unnamed protein product [Caenorhabditis angaria]|uniref:Doublecortin domain-containing protein n=1 Tax=Caenorhabditis angaria TaxID=860376 RepID=A0A9P1IDI7_9PELO|nr:unnamed protein product [Caenorhabditis angaria]
MSRGSFRSRSSDHVPIVPTMVSSNPGVKRIQVFRNGDVYFQGVQIVINTHRVTDLNILLDVITQKIGLVNGAKKLYTMSGVLLKDITKIKDNEKYVASSSHFTPMAYGGEKVAVEKGKREHREHREHREKEKHSRSKTKSKERKKKVHPEKVVIEKEEIIIPVTMEKPKKLKKKKKSKSTEHHHEENEDSRPPSSVISGTAEVEIPSEIEDSEHEEHLDEHRPQNPSPPPEKPEKSRRKSIWCW